jgi:hypothetical protein
MKKISFLILGITLAIVGGLILFVFNFDANFRSLAVIFALSLALLSIAASQLQGNRIISVLLGGLALAVMSFTYQTAGPEVKIVGTECPVIRDCIQPVLGGGFPVQYVVDNPGVSVRNVLALEDEYRLWPLIADTCFYICVIGLIRMSIQKRDRNQEYKDLNKANL